MSRDPTRAARPYLKTVSFSMQREEIVALVGRNGAGKSTVVHLALGLLRPDAGSVRAFGLDPAHDPVSVKQRIGFVGDQLVLPLLYTVRQAIALHCALFPTWDGAFENDLIERFSLGPLRDRRLGSLSKGQRQQVALLCAVCHRPELLLLDEPASGLDPAMRREFLETSIQLLNREGTAILFSSHQMGDVERLGARILLLRDRRIALDAPLDALRERTALAVAPRAQPGAEAVLRAWPGVLNVRAVGASWHAVVPGSAAEVERVLRSELGAEADALSLTLEELFIELADARVPDRNQGERDPGRA